MRPWNPVIALMFVGIAFAGCVGDAPEAQSTPQETEVPDAAPAQFKDDTGALVGQVSDDEGLPVTGAQVALLDTEHVTLTDKAGAFTFSNVAPGTYALVVQALGFESKGQNVRVAAGAIAEAFVQIDPIPVASPHSLTQTQVGNIQCSTRTYPGAPLTGVVASGWYTGVAVCGVASLPAFPPDKFLLTWELAEANAEELLLEMTWETTQSFGRGLDVNLERTGHINDGTEIYGEDVGESPLIVYANQERMALVHASNGEESCVETQCKLTTRVFAAANTTNLDWPVAPPDVPIFGPPHDRMLDAGFVLDQRFTHYLTSFHFSTKPETFSARPDA